MNEVQLYISGEKVELFKDEIISVNDTIQNVRDISKVFTAFSKQFNIPASRTNNKIFKHYYNYDIVGGFDARFKVDALIKLNGSDYKKGKIRLNSVSLKEGVPFSYKVVFFGETVTLSDLLGDDDLKALGSELTAFNQTYSAVNTLNGLTKGWTLVSGSLVLNSAGSTSTGDFIYPFISAEKRYYYDNSVPVATGNNLYLTGAYVAGNLKGLHYLDLKPAIKVYHLIQAIQTKYGITFSTDFFSTSVPEFYELFLWLHRDKGNLSKQIGISSYDIKLSEWTLASATELRTDTNTSITTNSTFGGSDTSFDFNLTVNVTGAGLYDILIIDNNTGSTLFSDVGLTGNQTKNYNFFSLSGDKKDYPKVVINTVGGITAFNTSMYLKRTITYPILAPSIITSNYTFNGGANVTLSTGLDVGENLPKMKVIDFLTSLFKTFNLTAYIENDIVVVKTLDDFYSGGVNHDITKYVDVDNSSVSRSQIYSAIDFKYQPPKTLFAIKSDEINNFEFGNLKYEDITDNFDGGKYEINVGFEHTVFERMLNENTGLNTDIQWGYFVDKDEQPTVGAPLLFYAQKQTPAETSYFDNGVSYNSFTKYMKPANTRGNGLQTINFGTEVDEFNLNTNAVSLFATYYNTFIDSIFNTQARIIKVKAFLPLSVLLNYTLADRFIISGKIHKINNITTNLQTGESEIELINEV